MSARTNESSGRTPKSLRACFLVLNLMVLRFLPIVLFSRSTIVIKVGGVVNIGTVLEVGSQTRRLNIGMHGPR